MAIENVRIPAADRERDAVLKDMSEKGYTLVAVTEDAHATGHSGMVRYWSLYFTKVTEEI